MKNLFTFFISTNKVNPEELYKYQIKNILIVKQHNQLGDMLCTFPMFASVRAKYPDAHITLIASPDNIDIVDSTSEPYFNEVILYDKKNIFGFYTKFSAKKYDLAIVPSTVAFSRTSHIIALLSGAKVRVGVSKADGRINKSAFMLNIKNDFYWDRNKVHQSMRFLDIASQIACNTNVEILNSGIHHSEKEIQKADDFLRSAFPDRRIPILGFHPGAGKPPNRWDIQNFAKLIKFVKNNFECNILITSGKMDTEVICSLKELLDKVRIDYKIADNFSIREISAILSEIKLYITNDTGTMHTAVYSGTPVIALFGPTNGWEWGPYRDNQIYLQSPTENINDITVDEVAEKINIFLKTNKFSEK